MTSLSLRSTDDRLTTVLQALARTRHGRGDITLVINPDRSPQEYVIQETRHPVGEGLVLEPYEGAPLTTQIVERNKADVTITAFCDGFRQTRVIAHERGWPLLLTENQAVVRTRDEHGHHTTFSGLHLSGQVLLAPYGLFPTTIYALYEQLEIIVSPYADLCQMAPDGAEGLTSREREELPSRGWQARGQRRARFFMERLEQVAALSAAKVLRHIQPEGTAWLLKDGPMGQFRQQYLHNADLREELRLIVGCVKDHPVAFFGRAGESLIAALAVGERTVAFLPRPQREANNLRNTSGSQLELSARPQVSWYLRVNPPASGSAQPLNGVVRLDIAATSDWQNWVDPVSRAVLAEFAGISARPDSRYPVMAYGIRDCELAMQANRIPAALQFATYTL